MNNQSQNITSSDSCNTPHKLFFDKLNNPSPPEGKHRVGEPTNKESKPMLPNIAPVKSNSYKSVPTDFKRLQHIEGKKIIKEKGYKAFGKDILEEFINRSDINGMSRAGQKIIAQAVGCSTKTVERWMKIYDEAGIAKYEETGWKETNLTTLLFIQHLNYNISDKLSDNLISDLNLKDLTNIIDHSDLRCFKTDIVKTQQEYESLQSQKSPPAKQKEKKEGKPNVTKGAYMFPNIEAQEVQLPTYIKDTIEEKVKTAILDIHQANDIELTLKRLKCNSETKIKILNDLFRVKEKYGSCNVNKILVTSFKYRLEQEGDPLNTKNINLKPEKFDIQLTHKEATIEQEQLAIEVSSKYFERRGIDFETMCDQIGDTTIGNLIADQVRKVIIEHSITYLSSLNPLLTH